MTRGPEPKVARLIDAYEFEDLGDELERRWTDPDDRASLRQLADDVNRRLLERSLAETGEPRPGDELENLYRRLTDDDLGSGARVQARNTLRRHGVDADALRQDFVSHQSIYTYLTNYRNADPPDRTPSEQEQLDQRSATVQRLTTRLASVTETALTELVNAGHLTLGEFKVLVTVRVQCTDCNTRRSVADLFANGGCECSRPDRG